jgi:hypothetical protein
VGVKVTVQFDWLVLTRTKPSHPEPKNPEPELKATLPVGVATAELVSVTVTTQVLVSEPSFIEFGAQEMLVADACAATLTLAEPLLAP